MQNQFSLAHLTTLGCTPPEMTYVAARAGYDFVSLRLIPMGVPGEAAFLPDDEEMIRQTKVALDETGDDTTLFPGGGEEGLEVLLRGVVEQDVLRLAPLVVERVGQVVTDEGVARHGPALASVLRARERRERALGLRSAARASVAALRRSSRARPARSRARRGV